MLILDCARFWLLPLRTVLLAIPFLLAGAGVSHAQTCTWTGGGTTDNWSDAANWNTNPTLPTTGDSLVFAGTNRVNPNVNNLASGTSFASITFNAGAGNFVITGNDIVLSGGATALKSLAVAGTMTLNCNLTFSTSAPTITSTAGGTLVVGGTINNGGLLLTVSAAGPTTLGAAISGTGGLTMSGAGTLTLSGANTYAGTTTVSTGTLKLGATEVIPDGAGKGNVSLAGTLDLGGHSETINGLSGAGTVDNSVAGGPYTLTVGNNDQTSTFTGILKNTTGTVALTKTGTGTLTLSGGNTYAGATLISGGTLQIGNAGATGTLSTSSSITNDATLAFNRTNAVVQGTDFVNVISGSGAVTQAGSGALTLNGNNSFSGGVNINAAGVVTAAGNNSALGSGTVTFNAGSVRLVVTDGLTIANNIVIGANSGVTGEGLIANSGNGNATLSGGTITINNLPAAGGHFKGAGTGSLTINHSITSSVVVLCRNGIVILAGGGSYSNLFIGQGTVRLGANNGIATNATADLGASGAANLDLAGYNQSLVGITKNTNAAVIGNSSTANDSTLTVTGGSTYAGIIQDVLGSGTKKVALTVNSSGTLTLSGANTYSGDTTISAGTLKLGAANVIPDGAGKGNVVLNPASGTATFDLGGFSETINGLSNSGAGSGIVDNTAAGGPFTLTVGGNNQTSSFSGTIQNTSGTLALTKTGTGTLTLSGANTYAGTTTVSAGTLKLGATGVIPDGAGKGNVSVAGTLDLGGYSETINGLSGAGTVDNSVAGGPYTLTVGNNDQTSSFSGTVKNTTGTMALTKIGTGTLTLSNTNNAYSGDTTISAGSLKLGASNVIPDGAGKGNVVLNPASGTATFDLGSFSETINGLSNSGAGTSVVDNTSGAGTYTLTVGSNDQTGTFNGTIRNTSGTLALTKTGTGTLTLGGADTYSGTTTISAGTLKLGNSSALPGGALSMSGTAILDLNTYNGTVSDVSSSVNTATITNNAAGTGTATFNVTAFANTINSLITNGATAKVAVKIANNITANQLFPGTNANTFSGGLILAHNAANGTRMRVTAAITTVGSPGAIVSCPYGTGPIYIGEAATDKAGILFDTVTNNTLKNDIVFNTALGNDRVGIRLDTTGHTFSGTITSNLAPATFCSGGTASATLTGRITGPLGLTLNNTGGTLVTITLNNAGTANDYQGDTNIMDAQGVLALGAANQIPNGSGKGNLIVTGGQFKMGGFSEQVNGLSGTGTVDGISGTPALTVGDNDATAAFSGVIKNTAGALVLTKIGLGAQTLSGANTFSGGVNLNAGTLNVNSTTALGATAGRFTIAGGTTIDNTSGSAIAMTSNNPQTWNGDFTFTGTSSLNLGAGAVDVGAAVRQVTVTNAPATLTVGGAIGGTGGLTKSGAGTLTLSGANAYTGATLISAGTLQIGNAGTSGSLSTSSAITNNATLVFNRTDTVTEGTHFASSISGSGAVTQAGSGTLMLSGINTYSGATTVNAGTLAGTGTVSGALTLASGTTLAPGTGGTNIGILTSGAVTMNASSTYSVDLDGTTPTCDQANSSSTVTCAGTLTVASVANSAIRKVYTIVNAAAGVSGTFNGLANGALLSSGGRTFQIAYNATTVTLTDVVHTNPRTWTGLGGDDNWSTAANWDSDQVPVSGDDLVFAGTTRLTPNNDLGADTSFNSVTFNSGAGAFTISGNRITLAGGITNNSSSLQTLNMALIMAATCTCNAASGDIAIGGILSGAGGLTKTGAGTLTLTGTNIYTGATTISTGTLQIGNGTTDGSIATSASITDNAALVYNLVGARTYANVISGTGSLTKAGAGTLTLSGANTYNGTTTISAGTLKTQGSAFWTTARTWSISSGAVLNIDGNTGVASGTTTISGTGTLRVTGGTFANESPNSPKGSGRNITMSLGSGALIDVQSGATMINGGWQNINWTANLASLNVDGTFNLWDGNTVIVGALTGSGTVGVNSNGKTLSVGANNGSGTFSGVMNGNNLLTKTGSGTLTLSNTNTYTGATTVSAGTLLVNGSTASGSAVAVNSGGTLGGTGTVNGSITMASGGTLAPGAVSGVSVGKINTAGVTCTGGTYSVDLDGAQVNAEQVNSSTTVALGAGVVTLNVASIANSVVGKVYIIVNATTSVSGTFSGLANNAIFTAGGRTLQIAYNAKTVTLTDVAHTNPRTWTGLGGNDNWSTAANWDLNQVPVIGDDLIFDGTTGLTPNNDLTADSSFSSITFNSGAGAFTIGGNRITLAGNITNNSANLQNLNLAMIMAATRTCNAASGDVAIGGILSGAGGLTKTGAGTLTLTGTNTYTGVTTISTGTLQIGNGTTDGSIATSASITDNGTLVYNLAGAQTCSQVISGTGSLTKTGAGTLTLTAASTYAGATIVNSNGMLKLGATSSVRITGVTATSSDNNYANASKSVDWSGMSTGSPDKAATQDATYQNMWTPRDARTSYIQFDLQAPYMVTEIFLWQYNQSGNPNREIKTANIYYCATYPGHTAKSDPTGWTLYNPGNYPWPQASGAVGNHTVVDMNTALTARYIEIDPLTDWGGSDVHGGLSEILFYGFPKSVNCLPSTTVLSIANSATLDLNGSDQQVASLADYGGGGGSVTNSSGTLDSTLTVSGSSVTSFSGVISDGSTKKTAVMKGGSGTLTLSNTNTYTGATTVNAGTLLVTGSTASGSAVAVNNGGTLGGTGTVSGTIAVAGGGTLSPGTGGTSIGALGTGAVTMNASSTYLVDLDGTAPTYDQLNSSGTVACAGTLTIASGANMASGKVFIIVNAATSVSGTFSGLANGATFTQLGRTFQIAYNAKTVTLTDVAHTNPRTWTGLGGDDNWSTAANWDLNQVPVSGDDLVFAGTTPRQTPYNDLAADTSFNSITFSSGAGAFTLGGNRITLAGNITNSSSNLQTLNLAAIMAATRTLNAANGNMAMGGILSGVGGLTKTGTGTVTLTGTNTYTGVTTISAGTLEIGNGTTDGSIATSASITDNATLVYDLFGSQTCNQVISGTGGLTKTGAGTLTLTVAQTYTGPTIVSAGTLKLQSAIPGLYEGMVSNSNSWDTTTAIPQTSIQLSARWGDSTNSGGTNVYPSWGASTTWGYTGYFRNPSGSSVQYTFGKNFDDSALVKIDGTTIISNTAYNSYPTATVTLTPGWHTLELRFGQVSGPVGPNSGSFNSHGLAFSTDGGTTWSAFTDPGDGSLLTALTSGGSNLLPAGTALSIASGATLDLGGNSQQVASLANQGGGGGSVTNSGTVDSTLTVSGSSSTSFGGVISDGGSNKTVLTKAGSSMLTLSGANTYTGATTVNGGTLKAGVASVANTSGAFGKNSAVTLANTAGVVLDLDNFNTQIGSLTGGGTTGGNVTLGSGTLSVGGNNTSPAAYAGVISGSTGCLTKIGTGTFILGGTVAHTYTGATTVNAGTMMVTGSTDPGSAVAVNNGGTLGGTGTVAGTITMAGGATLAPGLSGVSIGTLSTGAVTMNATSIYSVDLNGTAPTYDQLHSSGAVACAGTLIVASVANSALGKVYTVVSASGGVSGAFSALPNGALFTLEGRTLQIAYNATTVTLTDVAHPNPRTWTGLGGDDNWTTAGNWDSNLAPAAGDDLIFAGTTRPTPHNDFVADTRFGSITFNAGAGAFTLSGNPITLEGDIANNSSNLQTVSLDMSMAATRTVNAASGNVTLGGTVSGAGGLTKTGANTLTLSGLNTYAGATAVQNGTLSINSIKSVSGGASAVGAPVTVANGTIALGSTTTTGVLVYTGSGDTTDRVINLAGTTGGGIIDQSGTGALVFSSALTASGTGAKTLTLQGSTAGTGQISNAIVNGSGTTAVTKAGSGTWTLAGANTYTGTTTVSAGTLKTQGSAFSTTARTWSIASGAVLNLDGDPGIASGTTTISGAGTLRFTGGTISAGSGGCSLVLALGSGGLIDVASGGTIFNGGWQAINWSGNLAPISINGSLNIWDGNSVYVDALTGFGTIINGHSGATATTLIVGVSNGSGVFSGSYSSDAAARGLTKMGSGMQTLTGPNSYTGATTVSGGTLRAGVASVANVSGAFGRNSAVTLANTAGVVLDLAGFDTQIGSLTGGGTTGGNVTLGSGTLSVGGDNTSPAAYAGVISGPGGLTKIGTGTFTLGGTVAHAYTGATTVNAGTLLVTGSTDANSAVAVNNGGTLGGTGTVAGAITMASGGTLAPGTGGTSIATLHTAGVTMNAFSTYSVDLNGTTPTYDQISSTGTVACAGNLTLASIANAANGKVYTIISAASVTGTFTGLPNNALFTSGGRTFQIAYTGTTVTLTDVAHVNPRTWTGLGGNDNWSTAANWDLNQVPAVGDDLIFAGTTRLTPNNDLLPDSRFASITFSAGAGAFTIGGNRITLEGAIVNNDDSLQTLNLDMIRTGSSTVPWQPDQLPVLTAWYDASDSSTISAVGGAVNQWNDKSINALHLTQGLGSEQPVTGSSTIGGLNALYFNGAKVMNTSSNPFGATINNAFVIFAMNCRTIANSTLFTLSGSDTAGNRWQSHAPWGGGTIYFDCGGSGGANRVSAASGWAASSDHIVSYYGSTTDNVQQVYTDGSLLVGDATGHAVTTVSNIYLGAVPAGSYDDVDVGEWIIVNGTINTANREKLEGYLAHKWGLTANLPGGHPYKAQAPRITICSINAAGGDIAINGVVSGSSDLIKTGAGTLTLTGTNTYAGTTTISTGTLQVGNGVTDGSIASSAGITDNGVLAYNLVGSQTYSHVIGGTGSLTKLGAGTLTLSGANTFAGGVTLSAGTLNVNSVTALGTGTFIIADGTTFDNTSGGAIVMTNNNPQSWNGSFTFTGTNDLNLGVGAVALGATTRQVTVTNAAATLTVGGAIGGTGGLTKAGAGTLAVGSVSGTSTYNLGAVGNGTTISRDSLLASPWIAKGTLPAGTILRSVSINARLDTDGGSNQTWASDLCAYVDASPPPPSGGALLQVGGYDALGSPITKLGWSNGQHSAIGTTVVDTKTAPAHFPDTIDLGAAGLYLGSGGWIAATWSGTITVTYSLPGASTYSGPTTVNAGTLLVLGSTAAASAVTVNNGGTLGGTGTVNGPIALASGGTLAPGLKGVSIGTLTLGDNLTFNASSAARFDLSSSAAGANDKVILQNKTITCAGASISINCGGTLDTADYVLFDAGTTGTISGNFNATPVWTGTTPKYAAGYSIVTSGKQILLRYQYNSIPITVTAATNTKTYDGDTSAAALPTITSGALESGDTGTWSETYDNKNVGVGKTLTPAGTIKDAGNNDVTNRYNITFAPVATGVINARPITVTATTNTKIYDQTTSAAALPTITAGTLAAGDTATWSETYDTKNVGVGKTLTPTGTVSHGINDVTSQYAITFAAVNTGTITKRPLTVTATGVDKVYDGNTSATVDLHGNQMGGDAIILNYSDASFDTKDVGVGKPVDVTGITVGGADAGNYDLQNTTAWTSANITVRALNVSATGIDKIYDGSATATVTLSSDKVGGNLLTFTYSASFNNKHVGVGKTVNVWAIAISGGADAGNYALQNTTATTTASITVRPITVTAATNTKGYDGTTSAAAIPTITAGSLGVGDTAAFTETYDNKNVGTGKTLIPAGTVNDGNGGTNYSVTFVNNTTGVIATIAITVTATANTKTYDGTTSAAAIPTITAGSLVAGHTGYWSESYTTKGVGVNKTLTPVGTIRDAGNNDVTSSYSIAFVPVATGTITARALTVSATGTNKVYDGTTATSVSLSSNQLAGDVLTLSYASAAFVDRNVGNGKTVSVTGISIGGADAGNYTANASTTTTASITPKALTVTGLTANNKTYNGTTTATLSGTATLQVAEAPGTGTTADGRPYAGDTVSLTGTPVGTFSDPLVANSKTVTVSGLSLTGAQAGNYTLTPLILYANIGSAAAVTKRL